MNHSTYKKRRDEILRNTPVYDRVRKVKGQPALLKDSDLSLAQQAIDQLILDVIGEDDNRKTAGKPELSMLVLGANSMKVSQRQIVKGDGDN